MNSLSEMNTADSPAREPVSVLNISKGWSFYKKSFFLKTRVRKVDLPHTWNADDIGMSSRSFYQGKAVYEKGLRISKEKGRHYFLKFYAVGQKASVYVNGRFCGEHRGSFTAFVIDITARLLDGENRIRVIADNRQNRNTPPLGGDFNLFGGIYRDVFLINTGRLFISKDHYGADGFFISQSSVSRKEAKMDIRFLIQGQTEGGETLKLSFYDREGTIAAVSQRPVAAGEQNFSMTLDQPVLWQGRINSYLYEYRAILLDREGNELDHLSGRIGFRSFSVDSEGNFFLNGKAYSLLGVSRHQDCEGKGNALSHEDHRRDFDIIYEMGATAVRLAHYPQARAVAEYCDEKGILLWSEIPFVGYAFPWAPSRRLADNSLRQLKEMIYQNYNHCSYFAWGLFNEMAHTERTEPFIRRLHDAAKSIDPQRCTVSATAAEGAANRVADLYCWNRYFGWYEGEPGDLKVFIDEQRKLFPGGKLGISEYGAGGDPFCHTELLEAPEISGSAHPENWQTWFHEENWSIIRRAPVWGSFVWAMFDFSSSMRKEGARRGINDKGLVSFDRSVYKDSYYFYKANWNREEPLVYLTGKRFKERKSSAITVKAYSNRGSVELRVNGQSQGQVSPDDLMRCIWEDIPLKRGVNSLQVLDQEGVLQDQCRLRRI